MQPYNFGDFGYNYREYLSIWDAVLLPFYLAVIGVVSYKVKENNISENPSYRYYTTGLFVKIFGGILFTLVYTFYYKGGDTMSYFESGIAVSKLLLKHPNIGFQILIGHATSHNWYFFDDTTGWPVFSMYTHKKTSLAVIRFSAPILLISFNKYILGTVTLCWIAYSGIWRFYQMFVELFPKYYKVLALSILFIPSVVFWGSGIMKDTYTLACTMWFTYNFYMIFIKKKKIRTNIILIIINSYVVLSMKPYILIAIIPSILIWYSYKAVKNIKSTFLRFMASPFLLAMGLTIGLYILSQMSSSFGSGYSSVDDVLLTAQVTQQDLVREEQYGQNYYNIGYFEATPLGVLKKTPEAIVAGLFMPFLWQVKNPVMLISGIENFILLILSVYLILKIGPGRLFKFLVKEPVLLFALTFAVIFTFSVGLTSANFGAMVRYKIPALPFFISSLLIMYYETKEEKHLKETQE